MEPKWCNVGYAELSTTKHTIRIKIEPKLLENCQYNGYFYIGVNDIEKVLKRRKKQAMVYVWNEK